MPVTSALGGVKQDAQFQASLDFHILGSVLKQEREGTRERKRKGKGNGVEENGAEGNGGKRN